MEMHTKKVGELWRGQADRYAKCIVRSESQQKIC